MAYRHLVELRNSLHINIHIKILRDLEYTCKTYSHLSLYMYKKQQQ